MMQDRLQLKKLSALFTIDEIIVLGLACAAFISAYVAVAALAAVMVYLAVGNRLAAMIKAVPGAFYLVVFVGLSLVVSLVHHNLNGILMAGGMTLLLPAAMFIRNTMSRPLFESVLDVICAASLFSLLVIVVQLLIDPRGIEARAASTFINANNYAAVIEFVLLACVYKLTRTRGSTRVCYSLVLLLNLLGLYLSNSRSAIPAAVGAMLVFLLLDRRYKTLAAAVAASLIVSAVLFNLPDMQSRMNNLGADILDRLMIWKTAAKGVYEYPIFGQGFGAYALTCSRFGGPIRPHAHNLLLDLILNFGLAGVALLVAYLKTNAQLLVRLLQSRQNRPQASLVWAAAAAAALHGITDSTLLNLQLILIFLMLIALAGVTEAKIRPAPAVRPVPAIKDQTRKRLFNSRK